MTDDKLDKKVNEWYSKLSISKNLSSSDANNYKEFFLKPLIKDTLRVKENLYKSSYTIIKEYVKKL